MEILSGVAELRVELAKNSSVIQTMQSYLNHTRPLSRRLYKSLFVHPSFRSLVSLSLCTSVRLFHRRAACDQNRPETRCAVCDGFNLRQRRRAANVSADGRTSDNTATSETVSRHQYNYYFVRPVDSWGSWPRYDSSFHIALPFRDLLTLTVFSGVIITPCLAKGTSTLLAVT